MIPSAIARIGGPLLALLLATPALPRGDDDDVPASQDLRVGRDANKRYFLFGPKKDARPPAAGWGLVVILPGGDGSADFRPFVGRIYGEVLADKYLVAQPVAVQWTEDQEITWPTRKARVEKMKFTTEEFVEGIIAEVGRRHKLDPKRVFTLSWSSGGPAAYAISLAEKKSVTGSLVAMSVFLPKYLPPLANGKGHAYYLLHSPDDDVCLFRFAEQARDELKKHGARVTLATYEGGHGWHGDVYGNIAKGIRWLEEATAAKKK